MTGHRAVNQVRLVIADTGPINYLIRIGHVDLLPRLFERVAIPRAVECELSAFDAPAPVRNWIATPPAWLEIHDATGLPQYLVPMAEKPPLSL